MKDILSITALLILLLGMLTIAFCPFIIAIHTGNWWYLFLFSVNWIPIVFYIWLVSPLVRIL